jgi:hypothetical protein
VTSIPIYQVSPGYLDTYKPTVWMGIFSMDRYTSWLSIYRKEDKVVYIAHAPNRLLYRADMISRMPLYRMTMTMK